MEVTVLLLKNTSSIRVLRMVNVAHALSKHEREVYDKTPLLADVLTCVLVETAVDEITAGYQDTFEDAFVSCNTI